MRTALAALACLFIAAHLPFIPPALEDIDSVNFALGVRDFDVAHHQPHPPGYPVYVAAAKAAAAVLGGAGDARAVVSALAIWSVLAGAALVVFFFLLFVALDGNVRRAWWAMGITVASPLFWFTALRPLSDTLGLAAATAAQALILPVLTGRVDWMRGSIVAGGFVAGLAAGIRVQTILLTAPVLLLAVVLPRPGVDVRARAGALVAALAGVLVWAVPLIVVSGGPDGYLQALGTQAGEDFSGVVMLWTTRTTRVAADAVLYSFLWPWGGVVLGVVVLLAALIGALRLLWQERRPLIWLTIAFAPYAAFHLLFHETITVRYALPLMAPVAYLALCAFSWPGRRAAALLSTAVILVSLLNGARAARAYGTVEAPAFQAMHAISAAGANPVGIHAVFRRAAEWTPPGATVLRARHGREWLALIERWRARPDEAIAFVSDPRRTDLALFDPHRRELKGSYRWSLPELPYVGGTRPGNADWYLMHPPGWILDLGWALSAEIGGVSARESSGPHLQPSVAWVRARRDSQLLMIGGRNLHPEIPCQLTLSRGDVVIGRWDVAPGFFFRFLPLGPATFEGTGYLPLSVSAASAGNQVHVSLEQFDLQPDGVTMAGFMDGWFEPEYDPRTSRAWRWMSEKAVVWVRPVGRDLTLTVSAESPRRYFDVTPSIRLSLAGQELARLSPVSDFTQEVRLPAQLLEAAGGRVIVESDRWFVPADRGESADPRHLALRVYDVRVR